MTARSKFTAAAVLVAAAMAPAVAQADEAEFFFSSYPAGYSAPDSKPFGSAGGGFFKEGTSTPQKFELLRGGVVVDRNVPGFVPLPGDVGRVVALAGGAVLAQATYTPPGIDPTTCAGQNGFAGTKVADATVGVSSFRRNATPSSSAYSSFFGGKSQKGVLRAITDTTYRGTFAQALAAGDFVTASQSVETVAGALTTSATSLGTSVVGACPVPPADTTPPAPASAVDLVFPSFAKSLFIKFGLTSFVTVAEPSTIIQELFLKPASRPLPPVASAAQKKKAKKGKKKAKGKAKTVLVGRATKVAPTPGTYKLTVKPSKSGRKALSARKAYSLVLRTSLKDAAGNVTSSQKTVKVTK